MCVMPITDVVKIFCDYGIAEDINSIFTLADYSVKGTICKVIKIICSKRTYVMKMLSDEIFDFCVEEKQAEFSEQLRFDGMSVSRKYRSIKNGKFTTTFHEGDVKLYIQVEDYSGSDLLCLDRKVASFAGTFLGKMHRYSLGQNCRITRGVTYNAVVGGKTSFDKLISVEFKRAMSNECYNRALQAHNKKTELIRKIWTILPNTAVHGDLGFGSNIVEENGRYTVIDFNQASDECVLGDLLITWYSSLYSSNVIGCMTDGEIESLKDSFFASYLNQRGLCVIEQNYYNDVARFLNGVYFTRYINDLYNINMERAVKEAEKIALYYESTDLDDDLRLDNEHN